MGKNRLEAFSDGVLAIIITIMVLEIKVPHGDQIFDLLPMLPKFCSYILSFIYIGIYWNNHHHLLHAVKKINGRVLIANLNLLFWLSLVPFATAWMGENHFSNNPVALYATTMLMCAVSYTILVIELTKGKANNQILIEAIGDDFKGKISIVMYIASIIFAYIASQISLVLLVAVAIIWFIPDKRIERILDSHEN